MSSHSYIIRTCSKCGVNWKARKDYIPLTTLCSFCIIRSSKKREDNYFWKGGVIESKGYYWHKIPINDPLFSMTNNHGYIAEHRLIMALHLGRCLTKEEVVHHLNGNKKDNWIVNLELVTKNTHQHKYKEAYDRGFNAGWAEATRKT